MKTALTAILILITFFVSSQNCVRETSYYKNGRIGLIEDYDSIYHNHCGVYKEYDSSGVLLIEGMYIGVDSVECKDCYAIENGVWTKYNYEDQRELKIGIWKYYYPNGQLKMSGEYSTKVRAYSGETSPIVYEDRPINVGLYIEQLKTGVWNYYDEKGKILRIEEYIDGDLVYLTEKY